MADYGSFPDDISALWGPTQEGMLTPAPPPPSNGADPHPADAVVAHGNGSANGNGSNGQGGGRTTVVEHEIREDVARLAQAIAANHVDVVRRSDLDAVRSDFTHQFAVALYELMAASNARLASAEDHIGQRVTEALDAHASRLLASLEEHRAAAAEIPAALGTELATLRQRLGGPLDGLVAFQRDLRHEVGQLHDVMRARDAEWAQRGQDEAERLDRVAIAAGELGDVPEVLSAIRADLAAVREELAELRGKVEEGSQRRKSGWRRRNS